MVNQAPGVGKGSVFGRRWRQHLAGAVGFQRADETGLFHGFDHPRSTVVADLEPALDTGDRRFAGLGHDAHGFVVERIQLRIVSAAAAVGGAETGYRHGGAFKHFVR